MKRIALLLALFCLGLVTASLAVAKAPPGKGKPDKEQADKGKKTKTSSTDAENCKPKISVILKGKFVSGGGSSFTMDVTQSNFHGRELVGKPLSVNVDEKTRFVRRGPAELSDFEAGDRLNVQARACKKSKRSEQPAASAAAAPMVAKRVVGRPANPAEQARDGSTTTTTP